MYKRALSVVAVLFLLFFGSKSSAAPVFNELYGKFNGIPVECAPMEKFLYLLDQMNVSGGKKMYGCLGSDNVQYTVTVNHVIRALSKSGTAWSDNKLTKVDCPPHEAQFSLWQYCSEPLYTNPQQPALYIIGGSSPYINSEPLGYGWTPITPPLDLAFQTNLAKIDNAFKVASIYMPLRNLFYGKFLVEIMECSDCSISAPPSDPANPPTNPPGTITIPKDQDPATNCWVLDIPCNFIKLFVPKSDFFTRTIPLRMTEKFDLYIKAVDAVYFEVGPPFGRIGIDFAFFILNDYARGLFNLLAFYQAMLFIAKFLKLPVWWGK